MQADPGQQGGVHVHTHAQTPDVVTVGFHRLGKFLNDNNSKQIKSPKKEIRRNEKQKERPGKMKEEHYNLTPKWDQGSRFCWQLTQLTRRQMGLCSVVGRMKLRSPSALVDFWNPRVAKSPLGV